MAAPTPQHYRYCTSKRLFQRLNGLELKTKCHTDITNYINLLNDVQEKFRKYWLPVLSSLKKNKLNLNILFYSEITLNIEFT